MLSNRLKELRKEHLMSLEEVANAVEKLAGQLSTSVACLLGIIENSYCIPDFKTTKYLKEQEVMDILITKDTLAPDILEGACVQIRELEKNEELTPDSFYYIEFNQRKVVRMVVGDVIDRIDFLPMEMNERRIAYVLDYVKIIGKAVSMKVFLKTI